MNRLIITNGQSGVDAIRHSGVKADFLSWDDVLHDGAVPAGLGFAALCERRITEIVQMGWGTDSEIRQQFHARNEVFQTADRRDEIICWFEHDLYDQLQLWQILDQLLPVQPRFSVICEPNYISHHSPDELQALFDSRVPAPLGSFEEAAQLWMAFRQPEPTALWSLRGRTKLRFADDTIGRWAQCFPSLHDGLSFVERNTLELLRQNGGLMTFIDLFRGVSAKEQAQFMGDSSFFLVLQRMGSVNQPPIAFRPAKTGPYPDIEITEVGERQVSDSATRLDTYSDRWIGGVHLSPSNYWVFDEQQPGFTHITTRP